MKLRHFILFFAIFLLAGSFIPQIILNQQTIPFNQVFAQNASIQPEKIIIPAMKIDTQVVPGGISDGKWVLSEKYIHFIDENNTLVFYAHKKPELFQDLKNLKLDDRISIIKTNGEQSLYTVTVIQPIKATDVDKVFSGDKETITLFTCDGLFDESRLMVKAKIFKIHTSFN